MTRKKNLLSALFLLAAGAVFGIIFVSNYDGTSLSSAAQKEIKLGADKSPLKSDDHLKALNEAIANVAKMSTPSVVSIIVTTKAKRSDEMNEFFHFFPDFKFRMPEGQMQQGAGSGVIVTKDGYILTNNHVVEDASDHGIDVILNDTKRYKARVIGTDPMTDVAVIKIDENNLPVAVLGNSDELEVGQWSIAIGNPLGLNSTVTAGIVSYIGRNIGIIGESYGIENFIQTDAVINPGNSGGALVNIYGEVIGINTAIQSTTGRYQGYGFAIPINLAKTVAMDLIAHGKVERGYIGVSIQKVDETMAKANGLSNAEGVIVQDVMGEAAKEAGIKDGDIILSVDNKKVNEPNELQTLIAGKHPGDKVTVTLWRDGQKIDKTVRLKARTDAKTQPVSDEMDEEEENPTKASRTISYDKLGITVAKADPRVLKERSIQNGVLVTDVKQYSEGFNRFLRPNDVIISVNKENVSNVKEFDSIMKSKKPGDAILLRVKKPDGTSSFISLMIPKD
ncbi:MAG: Do family serine endopeptidase [Acidobacteriota bacterium]